MKRVALAALLVALAQIAIAADQWRGAGWYRIEIFPELAILSAPFASEKACAKTLPKNEDDVIRCAHLAKAGEEIDRAIAFFGEGIEQNPRDAAAMNYRGILFAKKGDTDAALAEHARAMKANPDDYWAYVLRGKLYQKLGKRDEAIADFQTALAFNPGNEATVNMLKAALKELGAAPSP